MAANSTSYLPLTPRNPLFTGKRDTVTPMHGRLTPTSSAWYYWSPGGVSATPVAESVELMTCDSTRSNGGLNVATRLPLSEEDV